MLRGISQRLYSDIAEPDFGSLRFEENAPALERNRVRRILRVGLLYVPSGVDDAPIDQVRGPISLENNFHSVPGGAVLEVARLQHAAGLSGQTANPSTG